MYCCKILYKGMIVFLPYDLSQWDSFYQILIIKSFNIITLQHFPFSLFSFLNVNLNNQVKSRNRQSALILVVPCFFIFVNNNKLLCVIQNVLSDVEVATFGKILSAISRP
jgi:hypothetical protein